MRPRSTTLNIYQLLALFWPLFTFSTEALETPQGGLQERLQERPQDMVVKTTTIKGEVWPEVTVITSINADPLTCVALFAAYDFQKEYIPNLLKSDVILEKVVGKENDTQVSYLLDMPWPLSDSAYIHGHKLLSSAPDTYKVSWYMIKNDSAENVRGHALFQPHPTFKGQTQLIYKNLVTPKSFLAGVFKKLMVGDVIKSLRAIKNTIQEFPAKDPKRTDKYRDKIRLVLSGKPAYLP